MNVYLHISNTLIHSSNIQYEYKCFSHISFKEINQMQLPSFKSKPAPSNTVGYPTHIPLRFSQPKLKPFFWSEGRIIDDLVIVESYICFSSLSLKKWALSNMTVSRILSLRTGCPGSIPSLRTGSPSVE